MLKHKLKKENGMKPIVVCVILLIFPMLTQAGQVNGGEVAQVRIDKSGKGYVKFTSNLTNSPAACIQSGYESVLAFDTNEAGGKAIYSLVLAAQASGKKINATGTGACSVYGMIEDWSWGYIAS